MMSQDADEVLALLEQMVCIGAPTGAEHRRTAFVRDWLNEVVPTSALSQDALGNVLVRLGPADQPALLVDAHLDTVFPDEALQVRKTSDGRWHCPGIFDNTVSCAMLMVYIRQLVASGQPPALLCSFTVGEEGQGDLRGVRQVVDAHRDDIAAALVLDLHMGTITRECVGSTRWRVRFEGEGGHSWNDFGRASALHAACRWGAAMAELMDWQPGALTYNIGSLTGGQSINTIAAEAELLLDVRALSPDSLAQAEQRVLTSLEAVDDVKATATQIGSRPAASLPADHPLAQTVRQAHAAVGVPCEERVQSTNANYPMSLGIPSICMGIARGDGIHTRAEYLEPSSIEIGLKLLDTVTAQRRCS